MQLKKIKQNGSLTVLFFFLGVLVTLITYKLIPQNTVSVSGNVNYDNTKVTVLESNSLKESIEKIYDAVVFWWKGYNSIFCERNLLKVCEFKSLDCKYLQNIV